MFNMYQELADRIEELLKENKKLKNIILSLQLLYLRIPRGVIEDLVEKKILTEKEKEYWEKLYKIRRKI